MPFSLPTRIDQADFSGRRVLVRTDLGERIDSTGKIVGSSTEYLSLPTLQLLQERGAAVMVLSATTGAPGPKAPSLEAGAAKLSELLGTPVALLGAAGKNEAMEVAPGQVAVLENLARGKGDTAKDTATAGRLAEMGDLFVNDAPRATAQGGLSVELLPTKLPSYAGMDLFHELEVVSELISRKHNPLVAILGGTDVAGSVTLARRLMSGHNLKDIFIAGGIAYTYLRSRVVPIGRSVSDAGLQVEAFQIIERAELSQVALHLPVDHVVADRFGRDAKTKTVGRMDIPDTWTALDVGPKTVSPIEKAVKKAGAVIWHGPLGAVEVESFGRGTLAVAKALAKSSALSLVLGDSLCAFLRAHGYGDRFAHMAGSPRLVLELLGGATFPALTALRRA